jgi:hypothetical protein
MTQTVATTARTMSTAKPLLPEIAQTMVTSLKATYSLPCLVSHAPGQEPREGTRLDVLCLVSLLRQTGAMVRRAAALTAAVVVCIGLAGCGLSGRGTSSTVATTGACAMVTPAKKCPHGQQVTAKSFLGNTVWQHQTGR